MSSARAQQACEAWQRIGLVASGHATVVVPSPAYESDGTVYLGVKSGGLWKGVRDASCGNMVTFSWTQLAGIPSDATVTAVAMPPAYVAGTGARMYAGTEAGLVYVSTNDFAVASSYTLGGPVTDILAWVPSTNYVIISTRGGGILRSVDGLATAPVAWGGIEEADTRAISRVSNTVYAAVYYLGNTQVRYKDAVFGTGWASRGTLSGMIPTDLKTAAVGAVRHAHLASQNRGMWHTTDLDGTGTWVASCDGAGANTAFRVAAIDLCPVYASDRELVEGRSDGPFWSFNFGGSTTIACTPGTFRAPVTSVAYAPRHHQPGVTHCEIFLGTEEGVLLLGCSPRKFDDPSQGTSRNAIAAVAMATTNSKGTWAASADGLLRGPSPTEMLVYNAFYGDVPDVTDIELHPLYDASASCSPGKTTLFMAERLEGVFISNDHGSSWSQIGAGSWTDTEVLDIEVSPQYATDSTVFAATKAGLRKWNGTSWATTSALSATNVAVPLSYSNDWVVFSSDAAVNGGLYLSTNGGTSAAAFRTLPAYTDITAIAFSPRFRGSDNQLFFSRRTAGVYFTSEANVGADADFCTMNEGFTGKELNVRDLAASLDYIGGTIYLVAATELGPRRRKWDPANSSATSCTPPYPSPWDDCLMPSGWDPDSTAVAWGMLGSGQDVILGTAKHGVVWSSDDGFDFAQPGTGYRSIPSNTWATFPAPFDDRLLFITSEDGVFVSTTGGAEAWPWNQATGFCLGPTRGLNVVAWRDCAVPAARHTVFVGSGANQGIRKRAFSWNPVTRSYDFTQSLWEATSLSTGSVEQFDSTGQGATTEILASSASTGFYTSTDCNGTTWTQNNPAGQSTASSVRLGNDLNGAPPPANGGSTPTTSLPLGEWDYYRVDVPSGALTLATTLTTLTGDANLYLRFGNLPTLTTYDYRSISGGTATDAVCARAVTGTWQHGIWYIGVRAAAAGTTYQLTSTVDGPCGDLTPRTIYSEGFESGGAGWTLDPAVQWQALPPMGLGATPGNADPSSAYAGTRVLGTDLNSDGKYPASSSGYATSPLFSCVNRTGVRLRYRRWLNVEGSAADDAQVHVTNNGFVAFTTPYLNGAAATTDSSWVTQTLSIGGTADQMGNVRFRYSLSSNALNHYSGWNVDDVVVDGIPIVSAASLALGEWTYYAFPTDGTDSDIQVSMTPIAGNPDVYIRFGGLPTETSWMYHPGGAAGELVCINPVATGTYYIGVKGINACSFSLAIRRNVSCLPTPFTQDVNVSHRERSARLVRVPTPRSAPAGGDTGGGGDPVPVFTTSISWGTVKGLTGGVYQLVGGSWQPRNGSGWGTLANRDAQSTIQALTGNLYCGSNGNLFISEYPDQGATTWMDVGAYVAGTPSWDITDFLHNDNGDILVAMQGPYLLGGGVWLTANQGKAWMQLNQGFDASTQDIMDLVNDAGLSGTIVYYASSDGSGVYDRTITAAAAPVITTLSPGNGPASGGTLVTIDGASFANACITGTTADCPFGDSPVVWFGGTPVVASTVTAGQITVVTPAHTPGSVPIVVMNPDTRESTGSFAFLFDVDGSANPILTVTKTPNSVDLGWSPSGRVMLERSDSLPWSTDKSVDAVGASWSDPDAVLGDSTTYYYRVSSK